MPSGVADEKAQTELLQPGLTIAGGSSETGNENVESALCQPLEDDKENDGTLVEEADVWIYTIA